MNRAFISFAWGQYHRRHASGCMLGSDIVSVFISRQKKKRKRRRRHWLERWRPLLMLTPPSYSSREMVRHFNTLQTCVYYMGSNPNSKHCSRFLSYLHFAIYWENSLTQTFLFLKQSISLSHFSFLHCSDFPANEIVKFLMGFSNKGSTDNFVVESLDASFRYPQDFQFYIQNFTALQVGDKDSRTLLFII